jgi:transposase
LFWRLKKKNDVCALKELNMNITTKSIDHLGIVRGICKEIELVKLIDTLVCSDPQRKISVGEGIYALVLNGLGFGNTTLYLSPHFFEDKPIEKLFRPGLVANDFGSHSLSSSLDAIYKYGISKLFFQIALHAVTRYGIQTTSSHLDGTTLMVHGDGYETNEPGVIELKRGHNKQHRHDLRQFLVHLICSDKEGIPLFMSTASGNETDKTEFVKVLESYQAELFSSEVPFGKGPFVADCALYSAITLQKLTNLLWISRVPENINAARHQIQESLSQQWTPFEGHSGYKYQEIQRMYGGIAQRWLIVFSANSYKSTTLAVEAAVDKQALEFQKSVKRLCKIAHESEIEAQNRVLQWFKALKPSEKEYFVLEAVQVRKEERYAKGRRKPDAKPLKTDFFIEKVSFQSQETAIEQAKQRNATFILATNDMDKKALPPDQWLELYKNGQQKVEKGFKFLKDPLFMLDKIFLKLPSRIMALAMVMVLCLLVYALAQFKLRKALADQNKTLANQLNKQVQNPTIRWVFQVMRGIQLASLEMDGKIHQTILNLKDEQKKILNLFGGEIAAFYTI